MSQATVVVFAGYFEIEPEVNHSSGLLADRVRDLELKLSELNGSSNNTAELQKGLASELKSELTDFLLGEISNLQKALSSELFINLHKDLQSKLSIGSVGEPCLEESVDYLGNKQLNLAVEPKTIQNSTQKASAKKKLVTKKTNPKPSASVLNVFGKDVDRLTNSQLIERFGGGASSLISKQKSRHKDAPQKFINWTKGRDPHNYGWEYREDSKLYHRVK